MQRAQARGTRHLEGRPVPRTSAASTGAGANVMAAVSDNTMAAGASGNAMAVDVSDNVMAVGQRLKR